MTLGITLSGAKRIGDMLQFTSFPENYFRNTGEYVIDLDRAWVFDYNPYVVRDRIPSQVVNLWTNGMPKIAKTITINQFVAKPVYFSIADRTAVQFNQIAYLRHPRLYRYEGLAPYNRRIVIHTTGGGSSFRAACGEDRCRVLDEEVVHHIRTKYRNYELIQVGAITDVDAGVTDCRGLLDIWDTIKLISQASMFIGVDSGPSWIASCYPDIYIKKVLVQYALEYLRHKFVPMHLFRPHEHWHDVMCRYYNRYKIDAGVTMSYLKI